MTRAFTLVELLVGLAVSSIVFIAAISFYGYLVRLNSTQVPSDSLDQAQNDLAQDLVNSIRWATTVDSTPTSLTLNTSTVYSYSSGRVFKNGVPLTPANLTVTTFSLADHSTITTLKSLQLHIDIQDPVSKHQVAFDTVVSQRQNNLAL